MTLKRLACVTYSKDRPLQLDGALRSLRLHARDYELASVSVIFAASDPRFEAAYSRLAIQHPKVEFVRERDFKRDTIAATSPSDYVMFLVDDTVFIRQFEVGRTMDALANDPRLLGYSLRLGCNTRYCYTMDRSQTLPDFKVLDGGMLTFDWTRAEYDFGYPLELSSSVYRTVDVLPLLVCLDYSNPNTLETELAAAARGFASNQGRLACWETSVAVSVPVNTVQTAWQNRAGENPELSGKSLLRRYEHGSRLDVEAYTGLMPAACHEELALHYVADKTVPTVSVIIPCYRQANYLPDALTSILEQTFEDWEVIVVNDGSPDDTSRVVASLAQANPGRRIRLVDSTNRGLASARNLGVGSALGRYVLPLDADDRLEPTFLEHTVGLLESDESVAIVYTDVRQFGAGSNQIRARDFDPKLLPEQNHLSYCALFRAEVWHAVGGYNPNMRWGYEDWDFWVGASARGYTARRIPEPLFCYRIREGSMYATALEHDAELRAQMRRNHPDVYRWDRRALRWAGSRSARYLAAFQRRVSRAWPGTG